MILGDLCVSVSILWCLVTLHYTFRTFDRLTVQQKSDHSKALILLFYDDFDDDDKDCVL